jgi:hypothetical protein
MIAELRATQADVDARRHFTADKKPITDARAVIDEWLAPAPSLDETVTQSATSLRTAAESGYIEVG